MTLAKKLNIKLLVIILTLTLVSFILFIYFGSSSFYNKKVFINSKQQVNFPFQNTIDFAGTGGDKIEILSNLFNDRELVLYFHGYEGRDLSVMQEIVKNHNLISPAFSGYGSSAGEPSHTNIEKQVEISFNWALERGYPEDQITVLGQDVGALAAVSLIKKHSKISRFIALDLMVSPVDSCKEKYFIICDFIEKNNLDLFNYDLGEFNKLIVAQSEKPAKRYDQVKKYFEKSKSIDKKMFTINETKTRLSAEILEN